MTADDLVAASIANLRREIARGDVVTIVQSTGDVVTGRIRRVNDTDLEIRSDATVSGGRTRQLDLTIPLNSIASLDRPRDPLNNGILIGAGIGAGVGVALLSYAYAVDANESDEWLAGSLVTTAAFAGIGAMVGLAIDAAHSKPHLRYRREVVTATVRIAPILTRGAGVAVAVTF